MMFTKSIHLAKRLRILSILVLMIFGSLGTSLLAQNAVPDSVERKALLALYNSTDGANWLAANRWTLSRINSYPDSSSYLYGVTVANGDIESLILFNSKLNGTLPAELSDLTELQNLTIHYNPNLTGTIPNLSTLNKLIALNLSNNRLTGVIPPWIESLTNLKSLTLSVNNLSGPIPTGISALTQLNYVGLDNANLSMVDAVPSSFYDLHNLQGLSLESCGLNPSSVPRGISGFPLLNSLNLSGNPSFIMPDGSFPFQLVDLPALSQLFLRSDNIQKLAYRFDQLNKLNYLDMTGNNFSDSSILRQVVDTLRNVVSLKTLLLPFCQIRNLPSNFYTLSSLQNLYINNNNLQPTGIAVIGDLPALQVLYIHNNGLTSFPSSFARLATLQTLYAVNNNLSPVPDVIKDIPNLKNLYLTNNNISSLPSWFVGASTHSLNTLELGNNLLTLPLPDSLRYLTNLTSLNLSNNRLQGKLPAYFSVFTKIANLNLSFNKIDSPLPDLSGWTFLSIAQLQHNNLTGAVPSYLSNNPIRKTYVDLSFNHYDTLAPFKSDLALTLIVNNNKLDFTNILKVTRPIARYVYIPQDTVTSLIDEMDTVTAYLGDSLQLTASIDRGTVPPSEYQWFKYVDGVHDIPLTQPSSGGYTYTNGNFSPTDAGEYYYKITNPAVPGLVLVSRKRRVIVSRCRTNAVMNIGYTRYVCAFTFSPPRDTRSCRGIAYRWNFGDNTTSSEKNPVHGFKRAGTYTVSLSLTFKCGTSCQSDTTIQRQVVFDPFQAGNIFKESTIQVTSDTRNQILSTTVATFSDSWPLEYVNQSLSAKNSFLNGTQGVWRNDANHVYEVPRGQSSALEIPKDGTFSMEQFNWQQADLNAIPNWIVTNAMTQYSPFSYELENQDVLGIYSAALYDYGGHLPSANGVNMRNKEMAFTSFEYLDGSTSGNWVVGTLSVPAYADYQVTSGYKNMAIVSANTNKFADVQRVDVKAVSLYQPSSLTRFSNFQYVQNDSIVCQQANPSNLKETVMILKKAPFEGAWKGKIIAKNQLFPSVSPSLDNTVSHSGKSSLRVTATQTFKQGLLRLDSAKSYWINAWVSINNPSLTIPKLADDLGIDLVIKNKDGLVKSTFSFRPTGQIIEGWQQVKGTFISPIDDAQLEITFKPGSTGQAWYDDLRLQPEKGNMKAYVYNLSDYRLRAILDEENFASFFYYDAEGNLYLTKKETEKGIKTITENVSYQVEK
jgi:Leucine-rich repeat (LRR) protein/PKD repeat protein